MPPTATPPPTATKEIITREKFLKARVNDISKVYYGKRTGCRCGCTGGGYVATSFMVNDRGLHDRIMKVNDKLVGKRLKRAKELVKAGADVEYSDTYVDVQTAGVDKALTFHFDEVSKN